MRPPVMCVSLLCAAAVALSVAGCADEPAVREGSSVQEGTSTVEPGATCVPPAATSAELPAAFPSRLPLPAGSTLTGVERRGGADLVTGRVEGSADDVLAHFRDAAEPAGFAVVRDEDEGRAGRLQLFGATSVLDVTVAQLTCPRGSTGFTVQVTPP